ncbi:MAG: hypothetical protein A2289_09915 [Deltaproteobacteria bacterium RIFOXYA12_FULL_58_15]|nr:MAG: hypothetical protein A2289_09915 [Deltaproteobacteria bacterium RIFOXYA12_FULL_58_15]OGR07332.1 MAG: hypothetical protein A2341_03160 [Deltaproteobacteria bacterium RIFOXYB12_FULL_58_9]
MATRKSNSKRTRSESAAAVPNIEPDINIDAIEYQPVEVTPRTCKDELVAAYNELVERYRTLEKQLPPGKSRSIAEQQLEVVQNAQQWTVERVINSTGQLKLGINMALENLARQLTTHSEQLAQIDLAIDAQTQRLAQLHDIEVAADSLAILLDQNQKAEQEHAATIAAQQQEAFAAFASAKADVLGQIDQANDEFTLEMARKRLDWDEEQRLRERDRNREQEEHDYEANMQRLREVRAYEEEKNQREKELKEREAQVVAHEEELSRLRGEVDGMPKRIDKAVAMAVDEAKKLAAREAEISARLLERDRSAAEQVAKLQIANLEARIAEQSVRLTELARQAELASNKVEAIATKAIEGAARTPIVPASEAGAKAQREASGN